CVNISNAHRPLLTFPTRRSSDLEHRNAARKLRRQTRRALLWMAHHNGVNVGADNRNGIRQGLAFFTQRRIAAVREAHHARAQARSEEHTSELQSRENLVCRLLLE